MGKVEGESMREIIVMLKEEVERRALRMWVPIVPLAFWGVGVSWVDGLEGVVLGGGGGGAYSYEGDRFDVVVVGHCRRGDCLFRGVDVKCSSVLFFFVFAEGQIVILK